MSEPITPEFEGDYIFAEDRPFPLFSGGKLRPARLRYAIYGKLNERRDNVILVCHQLSGSARVGDWWPQLFGDAGVFNLERDCIVGINIIGSCYGSTGPRDINPETGEVFGAEFPLVSVRDWVQSQALLLDHLRIDRLRAVIGGSIGGMQAIQWAIDFPERVERCIGVGAAPLTAMGLALNHLQRLAIFNDTHWHNGRYDESHQPKEGLALARAIAMISYKSAGLLTERYMRKPNRNSENPLLSLNGRYDVAGYLDYQGERFTSRFDASSYMIITKAMDNFDPGYGYPSEQAALERIRARVLLIGISSDWLFPAAEVQSLTRRMKSCEVDAEYAEIESSHGHDGFLAEPQKLTPLLNAMLRN
jgi:homoserine O-acetyltransferase/O-succinyltransferase